MKKILFVVVAVFALALASCKNNAEATEVEGVAPDTTEVVVDSLAVDSTAVAEVAE